MKNILKFAVVLLLLFAMVGTASATISSLHIDSESGDPASYSIGFSWDEDDTSGTAQYNVSITDASSAPVSGFPQTIGTNSSSYSGPLTAGIYTITVYTEGLTDTQTTTFEVTNPAVLPIPVITDLISTSNSNETHFELTWSWTPEGTETLQLYNGSGWEDVTTNSGVVKGNPNADTSIVFRTTDGTTNGNNKTEGPIQPVGIVMSENTTDSITWELSNWTNYNYTVKDSDNNIIDSDDLMGSNSLVVDGLTGGKSYTITVRGTDGTNFSLFNTNTFELEAANPAFINDNGFVSNKEVFKDNNVSNGTKEFSIENGTTFYLNITANEDVDFEWKLEYKNGENWEVVPSSQYTVSPDTANNSSNISWKPNRTGDYRLNLTMDGSTGTQELSWDVKVTPKTTGDRIWDESLGMPTTYTWTARSFSGFYYDLDTGEGSEFMKIEGIGRTIDEGDITYQTTTSDVDFAYDDWETYQIVGFMGDKYYAGRGSDSLMRNGNLSKVLVDSDDSENYRVGQYIPLEEGYSVKIDQIDVNGNAARFVVEKDGRQVGDGIVNTNNNTNSTFVYEKEIGKTKVPFIMIHVNNVFMGTESSLVTVNGIFQISDKLLRLESGSTIDKMEIDNINGNTITMSSSERISLSQDSEVVLMGKMKFIVADSSTLRFAPTIEYTDPGIYEIRGTVSDFNNTEFIINTWTPQNFEGFYYDINDEIENSESIKIETDLSSTRRIEEGELIYTANTTIVQHEYESWGDYTVIGFMGEKYYAGLGGGLLSRGNLSKVLVDTDESRNMYLNQSLALEEGVSVRAAQIDVNGNSVQLIVEKDGRELYSEIVRTGNDLNYTKKIGSGNVENTTFVKVHVNNVFMGTESSIVTISGVFQASEELTRIEEDTTYGEMEVTSVTSTKITLENRRDITLSQDDDVEFMTVGNSSMYFKVGNNDTLRFAPVVEREIGSTDPLKVRLSNSTVVSGNTVTITVEDRGTTIEGVTITINGSTIGTTNSSGQINYTTSAVGTFRVNAEKAGYTAGNASLTVNEHLVNMTVRVSPETVYFGTVGTIKATDALNGSAVSDAAVYISGENVGRTNSSGELNYTFNRTGTVTINVVKEKYNNGTTNVSVSQEVAFAYANFTLSPDEPAAKRNMKLEFDVTNRGIKEGSHDLSLVLKDAGGNVIAQDNKTVSVGVGATKSVSLSVKAPEAGGYTLTLVESDSNITVDLPSGVSNVTVGEAKLGSTILYVVLAIVGVVVIAVIGFFAYLFGVKGANKDNYKVVAGDIVDDIKSKFQKK